MIPVSLELKNFFSHKDSTVDFTLFDSALLIGNVEGNYDQSNGCGKSALLESIAWCLFNKSRSASMDDIIFWGESFCRVVFIFKHNGILYRVIRKRIRSSSTTTVDFSKQDSQGNWIDISGSTPSLTNSEIEKTIKLDYKTFVNSIYFRQNDISEFSDSDPARKKEILKSIIDLSKWDSYEEQSKDQLRSVRQDLKILESRLEHYDELIEDFERSKLNLSSFQRQLNDRLRKREEEQESLQNLTEKYQNIKKTLDTAQWDQTIELIEKLKQEKSKNQTKFSLIEKNSRNYQDSLDSKKLQIENLEKQISSLELDPEIDSKISFINNESIEFKSKFNTSKALAKILSERQIVGGTCYVCQQTITDELHHNLLTTQQEELESHQKTQIFCQNKLNELSSKLKGFEKIQNNNKQFEILKSKISNLKTELKIAEEQDSLLKIEKEHLERELSKIEHDLQLNAKILDSIKNNDFQELHSRIVVLRKEVQNSSTEIEKLNHQIGILTEKNSNLSDKIQEMNLYRGDFVNKQKRMVILEKLAKYLGKNGIQTILLNAVIDDLEKTANVILVSICHEPFEIFLDTQRVGADGVSIVDTLDLRVKKEGIVQNFKSLSGGEQFRISLALRIALSEISSRHGGSSLEFLLLDEINSPLDRQGTESLFVNVIKALEKKYKILVITHNDALKEKFTNVLDITKINGESSINYLSM